MASKSKTKYTNEFSNLVYVNSLAKGCFSTVNNSNRDMEQKKTSITKSVREYIEGQYTKGKHGKNIKFTFLNKYENINYEGFVEIENNNTKDNYIDVFYRLNQSTKLSQFNKYRRYDIKSVKDGQVTLSYIDSLGNAKTRTESVLLLKNYIKGNTWMSAFYSGYSHLIESISATNSIKFTYKITNNINDKLEVAKMNNKWQSCQGKVDRIKPGEYARGFYDFFSNGCIAPLIIYQDGQIVGRSAFRIFFDEDGNRYINLERIFGHGHLINNLKEFCTKLTKKLLLLSETLTVSERFTVTNTYKTNPWFDALKSDKDKSFELSRLKKNLRQPKRLINKDINQGYYQDSMIYTLYPTNNKEKKEYIYDCINPGDDYALHTITLK